MSKESDDDWCQPLHRGGKIGIIEAQLALLLYLTIGANEKTGMFITVY
ncbi:MAG: hypothetical protein AABY76_04185 [Planctomycetota bacterium]